MQLKIFVMFAALQADKVVANKIKDPEKPVSMCRAIVALLR